MNSYQVTITFDVEARSYADAVVEVQTAVQTQTNARIRGEWVNDMPKRGPERITIASIEKVKQGAVR